jgi:hypothetical protein
MGNWGEGDRFDRGIFDSTNRITFHGAKSTTLGRALLLEGAPQWTGMPKVRDDVSLGILNGE